MSFILFTFCQQISTDVFIGQTRLVAYGAVNLIAYAFYIAVTLLFYYMFKPMNRALSLLAAFFSFAGCANEVLGMFNLAPVEKAGQRSMKVSVELPERCRGSREVKV